MNRWARYWASLKSEVRRGVGGSSLPRLRYTHVSILRHAARPDVAMNVRHGSGSLGAGTSRVRAPGALVGDPSSDASDTSLHVVITPRARRGRAHASGTRWTSSPGTQWLTLHNVHYRRRLCKTRAILEFMRKVLCAALLVAATAGFIALPAGADTTPGNGGSLGTTLFYDYSDNSTPPSAGNGVFNIIVDVLPANIGGLVRMVAVAPANANEPNLVCAYQTISKYSQVECAFNFTASGVWTIKADYVDSNKDPVSAMATANLRVGN